MLGTASNDLFDFLINARWDGKEGLVLDFNLDVVPHIQIGGNITIRGKVYPITDIRLDGDKLHVNVRGLKFELLHFKQLNKCQD